MKIKLPYKILREGRLIRARQHGLINRMRTNASFQLSRRKNQLQTVTALFLCPFLFFPFVIKFVRVFVLRSHNEM